MSELQSWRIQVTFSITILLASSLLKHEDEDFLKPAIELGYCLWTIFSIVSCLKSEQCLVKLGDFYTFYADYFWWSLGTKMSSTDPEAKSSWAGRTPVLWPERWLDVWSLKRALPQKLCGSCLSQKLSASVCTLSPVQTTFQQSPGTKMAPADPEAKASRAWRTPVLWVGRWSDVSCFLL